MVIDQSLYNRQIDNIGSLRHLDIQYNSTSSLKVVGVDVRNFLKKGIAIYFEVGATEYSGYITSNSLSGSDTILTVILNDSTATVVNVPNSTLENVQASSIGGFGKHIGWVRWTAGFFQVGSMTGSITLNRNHFFAVQNTIMLTGYNTITLGGSGSAEFRLNIPTQPTIGEVVGSCQLENPGGISGVVLSNTGFQRLRILRNNYSTFALGALNMYYSISFPI